MTAAAIQCDLEMSGVLLQRAEARWRPLDGDSHMVPVLCLLVETDSASHGRAIVEQPFPQDHGAQCMAAARRYRKGARVTFQAPTVGIQLLVRNASHVHLHPEDEPSASEPAAAAA